MSGLKQSSRKRELKKVEDTKNKAHQTDLHKYQPSKTEREAKINMSGMTKRQVRETFMRPFKPTKKA